MDDVIVHWYSEPSFWMTALINGLTIFYLLGFVLLIYLLVRHLRKRDEAEKPKNH